MDQDGFNVQYLSSGNALTLTPAPVAATAASVVFTSYEDGNPQVYYAGLGGGVDEADQRRADVVRAALCAGWRDRGVLGVQWRHHQYLCGHCRRRQSGAADQRRGHRHLALLFARRLAHRLRERPRRHSAALHHGHRRRRGAAHLLWRGLVLRPPVFCAPQGDLIAYTPPVGRPVPHRHHGARWLGRAHPPPPFGQVQEGPTWAPNGRVIAFFRDPGGDAGPGLYSIDIWGRNEQQLATEVVRVGSELVAAAELPGRQTADFQRITPGLASLQPTEKPGFGHIRARNTTEKPGFRPYSRPIEQQLTKRDNAALRLPAVKNASSILPD